MSILATSRDLLAKTNHLGQTPAFPTDIGENTLIIHVFDTKNSDMVNAGLEGAATAVLGSVTSAFGDIAAGKVPSAVGGGMGNKALKKDYKDAFMLPFPNTISESLAHSYDEEDSWLQDTKLTAPLINGVVSLAGKTPAGIAKFTGSQAYKYYENKIAMYQSSAARSISLQWNLVPYNATESKNLHEIIRKLKMYSSPELLAGKLILRSPHFFWLQFKNTVLNEALQFNEVNITEISVEYSPGGSMETFNDDMPKSVDLTITFADREPKTHENWEKKGIKEVVGDHC